MIEEKPDFTGSKYRITMDNNGETMTSKEKILAYVKDKKVTLFFDAEQVLKPIITPLQDKGIQRKFY